MTARLPMSINRKRLFIGIASILIVTTLVLTRSWWNSAYTVGQRIDSLDGVYVYFNGDVGGVHGRNVADGYNIGLKYQCVEFVKRYYYQVYNHQMTDSYGHAKSFFDPNTVDGTLNKQRGLIQFHNPSSTQPQRGDLLVFDATMFNQYGHVAIVSRVGESELELIQQNPGPLASSRAVVGLKQIDSKWEIEDAKLWGWLRCIDQ